MNLKLKSLSLLLAGAAMGLTGCQTEDLVIDESGIGNGTASTGKVVYLTAGIALPTNAGSRSQTEGENPGDTPAPGGDTNSNADPDFEIGHDYENDVKSMILVFADKDNNYISHSIVSAITQVPQANANKFDFTVTAEIKYDVLETAYGTGGALATDQTVRLFAFCNYTDRLLQLFTYGESGTTKEPAYQGNGTYANWMDWAGSVEEEGLSADQSPTILNTIWAKNSFLMTNAEIRAAAFPASLDDWEPHTDKANPYDMTDDPIKVERAAARIDFRDASPNGDQVYPIQTTIKTTITRTEGQDDDQTTTTTTTTETKNLFSVKLTRMSLVNMSKNFYYLRRVSANGQNTGATIGGVEHSKNYVVDTDADVKKTTIKKGDNASGTAGQYFNFTLFSTDGQSYNKDGWYTDPISKIITGEKDTWTGENGSGASGAASTGTYRIWRYVTENTIPMADGATEGTAAVANQQTVRSTGVVFKGKIVLGDDAVVTGTDTPSTDETGHPYLTQNVIDNLENTTASSPALYCYNGILYAGIAEFVKAGIEDGVNGALYSAINRTLAKWTLKDGTYTYNGGDENTKLDIVEADKILNPKGDYKSDNKIDFNETGGNLNNFNESAPANEITVYIPEEEEDGWGYYCYYFYWNRHNDNLRDSYMGTMEFATVRNNVYKLSVSQVSQFGHPRNKKYDPDPVEEEDPDEEPKAYIKVNVEVLPWVVRVNDIKF